ncbi:hypothetical protein OSTOST_02251 [Ostertagia ostertagi]
MTVEGQIKNNANGSFENVLIFLDSGAQCNLIAASLADALALPRGDPYQCTMHGIGGTAQTYTAQQVTAVFRTRFGETLAINLSTKPVLTNAFPAATLTDLDVQFLKRNRIFLSNTATNGQLVTPAVLIGVESYEQIVLLDSPPTKLPSGLLAQDTVFGPALFGKSDIPHLNACSQQVVLACPEAISDIKQELKEIVPRNIGLTLHDGKGSTLWVFGDASQLAISCCSYVTHPPSNQTKGLLCAKTRLAPKERQLTIPRLELLAILISLRLAKTILRSYQGRITKVYIVNDSKIALAWTQTSRRLPLFVANQVDRIKKLHHSIQELGISLQLSYIESENNPADIATRPVAKGQFKASEWLSGPQWFKLQPNDWPIDSSWEPNSSDQISAATTCAPTVKAPPQRTHAIIDTSRFRYYSRALCTLARAMKALSCWIARVNARNNRTTALPLLQRFLPDNEITSSELKAAEQFY